LRMAVWEEAWVLRARVCVCATAGMSVHGARGAPKKCPARTAATHLRRSARGEALPPGCLQLQAAAAGGVGHDRVALQQGRARAVGSEQHCCLRLFSVAADPVDAKVMGMEDGGGGRG
jgi:hypothetical protein